METLETGNGVTIVTNGSIFGEAVLEKAVGMSGESDAAQQDPGPRGADQGDPERRAAESAEALAAEGVAVTARAVRARSGVRMTVAAEAARVWNDRETQAVAVPEPPGPVQARFAAVWREAFTSARAEFEQARAGWVAKVAQAETERDEATEEVERVEAERDEARRETGSLREQAANDATAAAEAVAGERSRADKAEARLEAVEAERDRVIGERDREQGRREAAENAGKRLERELSDLRESLRALKEQKN